MKGFWRYPEADRAAKWTEVITGIIAGKSGIVVFDEDVYAFKAVTTSRNLRGGVFDKSVLALLVPAGAVCHLTNHKCRVSEALVIATTDSHKCREQWWTQSESSRYNAEMKQGLINEDNRVYYSMHNPKFTYTSGKFVVPNKFDDAVKGVCAGGIHVFRTFRQAYKY